MSTRPMVTRKDNETLAPLIHLVKTTGNLKYRAAQKLVYDYRYYASRYRKWESVMRSRMSSDSADLPEGNVTIVCYQYNGAIVGMEDAIMAICGEDTMMRLRQEFLPRHSPREALSAPLVRELIEELEKMDE